MTAHLFMNPEGTSFQSQAVLAMLRAISADGIEESWSKEHKRYMAEPRVAPWFNGREQGYIVSMRSEDYLREFHIVFVEHRSSDNICVFQFEQSSTNPPTIDTAPEGVGEYEDCTVFRWGEALPAARHILERLTEFWLLTMRKPVDA